jgi:hypothetical protein
MNPGLRARGLASLLALLALLAGGVFPALSARAAGLALAQAAIGEALASRQVLVMLRMPPPHFHAGADAGGYGAGPGSDPGHPARRRLAQELAREHGLRIVDDWPMPVISVDCYVMEAKEGQPGAQAALLAALARDPRVAWAQPVQLFHGMATPSADPLYRLQPDARLWRTAELHRASTGSGVRVAVIDSGVDARHPDLAGQLAWDENFVGEDPPPPEAHGTAVAGVIAAKSGNGIGIAGVAPGARLMALRACWETTGAGSARDTRCSSFTLAKALQFAILHGARVINLSLGGPADRLLETLVQSALERGTAVVGAADPAQPGGFPAAVPGVLAVALAAGQSAPRGTLSAPGADVPTCLPGARWGFVSGSSFAAAEVSGLVALLAQLLPHASPAELRSNIISTNSSATLERTANRSADPNSGVTIDACASIARAAGHCVCSCHSIDELKAARHP